MENGSKHIMVVDDDEDFLVMMVQMLQSLFPGLAVHGISSGVEALAKLPDIDGNCLFMIDQNLREKDDLGLVDGTELIKYIRKTFRFLSFCYLMVSYSDIRTRNEVLKRDIRPLEKSPLDCTTKEDFRLYYEGEVAYGLGKLVEKGMDPLTGLYRREKAFEVWRHDFQLAKRKRYSIGCLWVDMDDLKKLNAIDYSFVGDESLRLVADVLRRKTRDKYDTIIRWGGDEFVIFFPDVTRAELPIIMKRIDAEMEMLEIRYGNKTIHPSVSSGSAILSLENMGKDPDAGMEYLLERAEKSAKKSKKHKKGVRISAITEQGT